MNEIKNTFYSTLDIFNDSSLSDPGLVATPQSVSPDDWRSDRRLSAAIVGINPDSGFIRNLPKISRDNGYNAVRRNDGSETKKSANSARKYFRDDGMISRENLLAMIAEVKAKRQAGR